MQSYSDPIEWATEVLQKRKSVLVAEPEIILKTPYSSVIKFYTADGNFYLKETPPSLFIEADCINILNKTMNLSAPK